MSKIPKRLAKAHKEALALARCGRRLTTDEREFVLTNFHEGAEHMNSLAGAFFTPVGLARDFALEVRYRRKLRILDLCAGIGALSYACEDDDVEIVCVEMNPTYAEVGRAVVPRAQWIVGSAFAPALADLGRFDVVISNPPFGRVPAEGFTGRYTGGNFEFRIIETASRFAPFGVFIVPQMSAPFRYSGQPCFEVIRGGHADAFTEQTGFELEPNCGIDTSTYRNEWKGTSPAVEIVCVDFDEPRSRREAAPVDEGPAFALTHPEPKRAVRRAEGKRAA